MKKKLLTAVISAIIIATSSFTAVNATEISANASSVSASQQDSNTSVTLGVGETYTLANNLKWSSSNTSVATVSSSKITAKKVGTANITSKASNGKTITCKVTVKSAPNSVKVNTSSVTLGAGEKFVISESTNSGSYSKSFSWSSNNTAVATVKKTTANKAEITAKSNGTAYITIKTYNGKTATCKVTVKSAPNSVKVDTSSVTLGAGEKFVISESTNSGSYSKSFSWSSNNTAVATVKKTTANKAEITAKSNGTAYITIKTYNGKTATCKVTVKSAPSSVKLSTSDLTIGTGEKFVISESTNSGSYSKFFTWSSSDTDVATVKKTTANKAEIVAKSKGTATITIMTYNGKKAECNVTVPGEWHDAVYKTVNHPAETKKVWVVDKAAYTYEEPIYEEQGVILCNDCNADVTDLSVRKQHIFWAANGENGHIYGSYRVDTVNVQVGTKTVEVPEEGHWETKVVKEAWTEKVLVKEAGYY